MSSRSSAPVRGRPPVPRWIGMIALALAVPPAAAEPAPGAQRDAPEPGPRARAEALFADGNAAIARNDAATAAERYRAAWELMPEARFVLNLGIVLAELGRTAAAAEAFTIYLADPACDPGKRPVLQQRLELWGAELGEITLDVSPASAVVEIDGARPLRGAPGTRVPVTPGRHLVTARAAGHRGGELQLTVAARGSAVARIALVATPIEAVRAIEAPPGADRDRSGLEGRPREHSDARPWKWIALGASLAAAGAGGYFGVSSIHTWNRVDERCPGGTCTAPADLDLAADAHRAGTRANIAFGISGAALVAAFLLWRFEPTGPPSSAALAPGTRAPRGASAGSRISIIPGNAGGLVCISGSL